MDNMFATSVVPKYRSIQDNLSITLQAKKHGVPICLIEEYLDAEPEDKKLVISKIKEYKKLNNIMECCTF